MTNLISFDNISLSFGSDSLLDQAKLQVAAGERVCLIGRNGAGKSSLLKIIEGTLQPDTGFIWRKPQLRLARLAQELPPKTNSTVFEFVSEGLTGVGELLASYHALTQELSHTHTQENLDKLERLQQLIDAKNAWHFEQKIESTLSRLTLNADAKISELSGGQQRCASLARAWVASPELLLLDEPTNHLDVETIQQWEEQLIASNIGLVFITHDRALLRRLATRIIELDRGKLTSWPGDYDNFLRRKEEMLHAEAKQNELFDKKLAINEKWIRQGLKARRARNEGRVRVLEAMRVARSERREVLGKVALSLNEADKSGQLVLEAKQLTQCYGTQCVINNFSLRILRGDRIGLIGANGAGKSTLLNILLGKISPQKGTVTHGTQLKIAYFDQLRMALDLEKSVAENITQGNDTIEINGNKRHIISYLADFLFTPERALVQVKALSGGECNRLLLARLFSLPSNLLVMDEPTNDLDIETLELLEELLSRYQGTLLLVSHDREFLDNVVTSTLVFEGNGKIEEYIGGYQEGLRQRKLNQTATLTVPRSVVKKVTNSNKKLTYKEEKELKELPKRIEDIEMEQAALQQLVASPAFYQQSPESIAQTMTKLAELASELNHAYQRWEDLERIK